MKKKILSNREIMNIFRCACEGGIRYSSRTDTITLVVNNTNSDRPNIWKDNILYFSGRLEKVPGKLTGPNKRLQEFLENGKNVYLFEVNQPGQYEYCGKVTIGQPVKMEKLKTGEEYPVFTLNVDFEAPLPKN